jgi:S1/P1 Nuclease
VDLDDIENCAFGWAKESNAFTCSYVYANLDTSVDLSGDYAQGAFPIIETQVAKGPPYLYLDVLMAAGLRLAVYLNLVVTGQPGWGGSGNLGFKVQS